MRTRRAMFWTWAGLAAGVGASIYANALASGGHGPIGRAFGAWAPAAFLGVVASLERIPMVGRRRSQFRLAGGLVVAGVAAWISYWHMVEAAILFGQSTVAAHLLPLSVDGLVLVFSMCLLDLQDLAAAVTARPAPAPAATSDHDSGPAALPDPSPQVPELEPAGPPTDAPSAPASRGRGSPYREPIIAAATANPAATDTEIAARLGCSTKTVERYRPIVDSQPSTPELVS